MPSSAPLCSSSFQPRTEPDRTDALPNCSWLDVCHLLAHFWSDSCWRSPSSTPWWPCFFSQRFEACISLTILTRCPSSSLTFGLLRPHARHLCSRRVSFTSLWAFVIPRLLVYQSHLVAFLRTCWRHQHSRGHPWELQHQWSPWTGFATTLWS